MKKILMCFLLTMCLTLACTKNYVTSPGSAPLPPTQVPTATRTPTSPPACSIGTSPTCTPTFTPQPPTSTSTNTWTPTITAIINLMATPYCGSSSLSIGKPAIGASGHFTSLTANRYFLPQQAVVTSMSVYCFTNAYVRLGIYSDVSNQPGTLIVQSIVNKEWRGGWKTLDVDDTYLSAGNYWLAVECFATNAQIAFDASSSGTEVMYYPTRNGDDPFPQSFGTNVFLGGRSYTVLANYCPVTAPPAATPTPSSHYQMMDIQNPLTGGVTMQSPQGIAVDSSGNIYATDDYNLGVLKFDPSGNLSTHWGNIGSGNGQFTLPKSLGLDSLNGFVYVCDGITASRVEKFDLAGNFLLQWGSSGSATGQFNKPTDAAVDSSGNVYVADYYNHRVQKFSPLGVYLASYGTFGMASNQMYNPYRVAIDSSNVLYVADYQNCNILKYNTSSGALIGNWGSKGPGNGQFDSPTGLAVDNAGNVYVSEDNNNRIQHFLSDGTYVDQWGSMGTGNREFYWPQGVDVDASGDVYVDDSMNCRILKFSPH